jgi:hypothetical protein
MIWYKWLYIVFVFVGLPVQILQFGYLSDKSAVGSWIFYHLAGKKQL